MQMAAVLVMSSAMAMIWEHGVERHATVVPVQAGHDDALAHVGQAVADVHDAEVEELGLVDAHHLGSGQDPLHDLAGHFHNLGLIFHFAVADDVRLAEPVVQAGLEHLDPLLGDLTARFRRRMSFSLLPLNMLPVITSIQPICPRMNFCMKRASE